MARSSAFDLSHIDDGWSVESLDERAAVPPPPTVLVNEPAVDESIDDGWCLMQEPATTAVAEAPPAPAPVLTLVPAVPVVVDAPPPPAPSIDMLLTAAEAAFFAHGETLHEAPLDHDDLSDLCEAPKPTFWQRLIGRAR